MPFNLDALKKLEAEATPGPWKIKDLYSDQGSLYHLDVLDASGEIVNLKSSNGWSGDPQDEPSNVELLVALRNSFPSIVKRLEAAEKLVEAVEWMDCYDVNDDVDLLLPVTKQANQAWRVQRDAALAAYKKAIE